jgi:hypothetical protein
MPSCDNLTRRTRFPVGTVMLLLALIGWGLQYKTSLILAEQDHTLYSSEILPAKILSDREECLSSKTAAAASPSMAPERIPAHCPVLARGRDREIAQCQTSLLMASPIVLHVRANSSATYFIRPPPLS